MKLFAIVILLVSSSALLASFYSMRALKKMGLLNKEYWKHKGLKNSFAYLLWVSLWLGSVGLLMKETWGKLLVEIGLVMFILFVVIQGIFKIIGLLKVGFATQETTIDVEEDMEYEHNENKGVEDPFMKNYIIKGIVVSVIMMVLLGGLAYWALIFLQSFTQL